MIIATISHISKTINNNMLRISSSNMSMIIGGETNKIIALIRATKIRITINSCKVTRTMITTLLLPSSSNINSSKDNAAVIIKKQTSSIIVGVVIEGTNHK
jgi:hypothetical protein